MSNEGKVVKVMTDEEWASLSEESRQNLITLFAYNQFPAPGSALTHSVTFNEREDKVLQEAMTQNDMSDSAVIRHFFRMGQMVNHHLRNSTELGFLDDQGDFNPIFQHGPKMAPMPSYNCPSCGEEYAVGVPCDLCNTEGS